MNYLQTCNIHCGELHFQVVSNDTKFDWINGYDDYVNKFGIAGSDKEDLQIWQILNMK